MNHKKELLRSLWLGCGIVEDLGFFSGAISSTAGDLVVCHGSRQQPDMREFPKIRVPSLGSL